MYLQAFADPDGDGLVKEVWFPNRLLPMKADIFSRVAWQLRTRSGVNIYAWMPVLSWDLDPTLTRVKYLPTGRKKHKFILNNITVSLLSMTESIQVGMLYEILPDMLLLMADRLHMMLCFQIMKMPVHRLSRLISKQALAGV